jgi:hypothetical protein
MSDTPPLGMRVAIRFNAAFSLFDRIPALVLRNVTEIHLGYETFLPDPRVAFESAVHGNGVTYRLLEMDEFEATSETEEAAAFYEE